MDNTAEAIQNNNNRVISWETQKQKDDRQKKEKEQKIKKQKEDPFPLDYLQQYHQQNITQYAKDKIDAILEILSQPIIDMKKLKFLCFQGIPDECKGLRSLCWKILIGYLPPEKSQWKQILKESNELYLYLCKQFFIDSIDRPPLEKENDLKRQYDKAIIQNKKSKLDKRDCVTPELECYNWRKFFDDFSLYEEVEKDTTRTRSEMHFFVTDTQEEYAIINSQNYLKQQKEKENKQQQEQQSEDLLGIEDNEQKEENKEQENNQEKQQDVEMNNHRFKIPFQTYIQTERKQKNDQSEKHYDVLSRILYVYAKANPGIRYVQGMNEILAPIYYIFRNDKTSQLFQDNVEADAFFCFTKVMGDGIKDCFIKNLDDSDTGIKTKVTELNNLLEQEDDELHAHLTKMGINPHFYALRWLMLVLTQEFELFDVLRMWDSFLSKTERMKYLDFLCIAILELMKPNLMTEDFAKIMETLQNVQEHDVHDIIAVGHQLHRNYQQRLKQKPSKIGGFFSNIASKVKNVSNKINDNIKNNL